MNSKDSNKDGSYEMILNEIDVESDEDVCNTNFKNIQQEVMELRKKLKNSSN